MPCESGKAYLAGAWIRPGHQIRQAWFGPLQIRFYDGANKELTATTSGIRPGIRVRCRDASASRLLLETEAGRVTSVERRWAAFVEATELLGGSMGGRLTA